MGQITVDQSHQIMAVLATNANWQEVDFGSAELQDAVIRDPKGAGERFTAFVKNGCRFVFGDPIIQAKPFNLKKFLGKEWNIWRGPANGDGLSGEEAMDKRSLELAQIKAGSLILDNCLNSGEDVIGGEEKLRRLKEKSGVIQHGGNVFLSLWEDYRVNGANSVLEWLYQTRKVTYLDFFGLVLRGPDGSRSVLYLCRNDDGKWGWRYRWLGSRWGADYFSAGSASQHSDLVP